MTCLDALSLAADAVLILEEHPDCPPEVAAWCSQARDVLINWLIDAQTERKDAA